MLYQHPMITFDLARERNRELERAAAAHRLAAGRRDNPRPAGQGRVRALAARSLRAFSNASHIVADATCAAATRLEGRSA